MENFGIKGLALTLYQRVILSYRTTLIGLLFVAGDALFSYFQAAPLPAWAHSIVGILAAMFLLIKEQNPGSVLPAAPPKGFARMRFLIFLALASVLVINLSSCAFFRPLQPKLISCVATPSLDLIKGVSTSLEQSPEDWQKRLDTLAVIAGIDAVVCAVEVVIQGLENFHPNGGAGAEGCDVAPCPVDPAVKLVRGYHYLSLHGAQPSPLLR